MVKTGQYKGVPTGMKQLGLVFLPVKGYIETPKLCQHTEKKLLRRKTLN